MHAGFHFTSDKTERMKAGLARLKRVIAHAENKGALILLENLNKEPDDAECTTLRTRSRSGAITSRRSESSSFGLSFTANHAHLVPEGTTALSTRSI